MAKWTGVNLNQYSEKVKKQLRAVQFKAYSKLTTAVVLGTPVDTGRLRASWTPSKGASILTDNIDTAGANASRHDIAKVLNSLKGDDTFNFANGQPYVRRIEYEGHSPQAPSGMMGVAAARWDGFVKEAVNET